MATNTEGFHETSPCNFLVEVSGNSLEVNTEALRLVNEVGEDNIPVVVLSVVGQPKSRKTSLMNSILKCFGKACSVPMYRFPFNSDNDRMYSDLKGREGILLWKYPRLVAGQDGTRSAWFFMDIWIEYPRLAVYKKLVDFCLSTSSAVIFSEPCNPNPEIYWQPSDSVFDLAEFSNTLHLSFSLHLFLWTDESSAVTNDVIEGPPELTACTAKLRCEDVVNFLTVRCEHITSTVIHSDDNEKSKSSQSGKWEAIDKILNHCLRNPLKINKEVVSTANLSYWFLQSTVLINGHTSTTKNIESDIIGICSSEVIIRAPYLPNEASSTSNCEHRSGPEQVFSKEYILNDDDVEMQEFAKVTSEGETSYKALTKSKVPLAVHREDEIETIFREIFEYYVTSFKTICVDLEEVQVYFEDAKLLTYHKDISEGILDEYGTRKCANLSQSDLESKLSEWFRYIQDDNNERKSQFDSVTSRLNRKLNELWEEIEKHLQKQLSKNDFRFALNFNKYFQILSEEFIHDYREFSAAWKKQIQGTVESSRTNLQQILNNMNTLICTYIQNFEILYKDRICFQPCQFEDLHQQNLKKAKSSTNYLDSGRKKLDFLCDQFIENYKKNLQNQNSTVYEHEGKIAKDAHDHAVEKYKEFMNQKISSTTLTEPELQYLHRCASERILSLFASNLPVPHTQPWISQKLKLEQSLASLLDKQKQKNHNHLKKVILAKKEGFNAGKIRFQEVMERSLPATNVSDGILSNYEGIALYEAITRLKEKIVHIHQEISIPWEEEFKDTLVDLKQQYINDNRNKKDMPISYAAAVCQDVEIVHQPPVICSMNKPYGIGLYVSLNKICVGVYVNQSVNFNDNVTSYEPPLIAFTAGRVSIGQDAEKDFAAASNCNAQVYCYKIFSLLQDHNDFEIDVSINGVWKTLGREEILSIFFHRLRINTQTILNQRINSCYVVATGLLTGGAKQLLKTSLTIAGFQSNTFIPCTTAMAISHTLKDKTDSGYKSANNIVVVYATSSLVEVASVDIVAGNVVMKTLTGDTNIQRCFKISTFGQLKNMIYSNGTELDDRIKRVLKVAVASQISYERIIGYGDDISSHLEHVLYSQLTTYCRLQSIAKSSLLDDIVRVAAALDAIRNQHPDLHPNKVRFPTYNNVSPYNVRVKVDNKVGRFSDFNSNTGVKETFPLVSHGYAYIELQEVGRDSHYEWFAGTYEFQIRGQPDIEFVLSLNEEANLTVSTVPKGLQIKTNAKSLVASECQRISESIKPLLDVVENVHGIKFRVEPALPKQAVKAAVTDNESLKEDLLRKVKIIVQEVKVKLENSKATSTGVTENIMAKIRKCEELMSSTELKIKQLELEKNNLERAAKLIKL